MPAYDLYTAHQINPAVDPARQKALLVAWLFLTTSHAVLDPSTRLVSTAAEIQQAQQDGAQLGPGGQIVDVNYIDLRVVYADLAPLTSVEVDGLIQVARGNAAGPQPNPLFAQITGQFYNQGYALLGYGAPPRCLAAGTVLQLN